MKLTIQLPGKVFDKLAALAINQYRHMPQQVAYIVERFVMEHDQNQQVPVEPIKEESGAIE